MTLSVAGVTLFFIVFTVANILAFQIHGREDKPRELPVKSKRRER